MEFGCYGLSVNGGRAERLGVVGEAAGEAHAGLGHGVPFPVAWPGGLLPLEPGDGRHRGMPIDPQGQRQSQRSRPWIRLPAVAGSGARLGWWALAAGGRACQHRTASSFHMHTLLHLVGWEPCDLLDLVGRVGLAADDAAAEHEGDDATAHVLVDPGEGPGSTRRPVSSRTSRTRPAWMVSSSSRTPPGGSQWPLSRRRTARSWPSWLMIAAATLTECRAAPRGPGPARGRRTQDRRQPADGDAANGRGRGAG